MTQSGADHPAAGEIVARAGRSYRIRHYLMALILLGAGGWFAVDGFYRYPAELRDNPDAEKPLTVFLNKLLGLALPPAAAVVVVWTLYQSRGEYRLSGGTLRLPGHPPIPLDRIESLDKKKWDRKGIAYVNYSGAGIGRGRARIDDYLYQQQPTDRIVKEIEAALTTTPARPSGYSAVTPPRPRL